MPWFAKWGRCAKWIGPPKKTIRGANEQAHVDPTLDQRMPLSGNLKRSFFPLPEKSKTKKCFVYLVPFDK